MLGTGKGGRPSPFRHSIGRARRALHGLRLRIGPSAGRIRRPYAGNRNVPCKGSPLPYHPTITQGQSCPNYGDHTMKKMTFLTAMRDYFGSKPGQTAMEFMQEIKALNTAEREWFKQNLSTVG